MSTWEMVLGTLVLTAICIFTVPALWSSRSNWQELFRWKGPPPK